MDSYEGVRLLMEQAKADLFRRDALERLMRNADFQNIVMKGYCHDEVLRLVKERALQGKDTPQGSELLSAIDAIGYFQKYLELITQQGILAEKSLKDSQEILNTLQDIQDE